MALIICNIIAYLQILSAGFNLWGVDPRILVNMPVGRNTLLVGLFLLAQLLGLAGAVLMFQKIRLGFVLSIVHHMVLMPALVITGWGLVMMLDDRVNATMLFMTTPTGSDISFFWSLGWGTVFQQVMRNVPAGSTYIGINLFAVACAYALWVGLDELDAEEEEREMRVRPPRPRPAGRAPLALPAPQPYPQPQRMAPQQSLRQPPRTPPRGGREQRW